MRFRAYKLLQKYLKRLELSPKNAGDGYPIKEKSGQTSFYLLLEGALNFEEIINNFLKKTILNGASETSEIFTTI